MTIISELPPVALAMISELDVQKDTFWIGCPTDQFVFIPLHNTQNMDNKMSRRHPDTPDVSA